MSNFDNGVNTALQVNASVTGNGSSLGWSNYGGALLWVKGISGDTITFEASMDGNSWYAIRATNLATGTAATTATADGLYFASGPGVNLLRARLTAGSGAVYVNAVATFQSSLI